MPQIQDGVGPNAELKPSTSQWWRHSDHVHFLRWSESFLLSVHQRRDAMNKSNQRSRAPSLRRDPPIDPRQSDSVQPFKAKLVS